MFRSALLALVGLVVVQELQFARAEPAKRAPVVIAIGQTVSLQMSTKRPISSVFVDREGIINVQPVPGDRTTIRVTGLAAGVARIHLTDDGGKTEIHQWGKSR